MPASLVTALIGLADDHLILGHRLSEWCGHAPMLEEDLAMPNIALDLIGQARALYSYAGELEGAGRDEDALAFGRLERAYRNLLICELPNGDFAHTMLRQFYFASFMQLFWQAAEQSADATLAAIAAKAVKEAEYHRRHCAQWVIRLGMEPMKVRGAWPRPWRFWPLIRANFLLQIETSATLLRAVYCQTLKRCSPHGKRMLSRYSRRPGSFRRQMSMRKRGAGGGCIPKPWAIFWRSCNLCSVAFQI
jgi:hypothetical protein